MYNLDNHEQNMFYALNLALKGKGKVSPNPLVGCVIVKNGKIIGEGYHKEYGKNHAEVNALNNCTEDSSGSDLYVNLEPCSYFGKTPPCINKIISSSIKNVYIGIKDPNPKINGNGIEKLQSSGINVFTGMLEKECEELNIGFLNWIKFGKPWVIAKVAQTVDGYMGIDSNQSIWITGNDSKKEVHKLRSNVDAILIGRKTAEVDNPYLTVRDVSGPNPIRVITDTFRKLSLNLNIFKDNKSKNIVLCSDEIFENSKTSFCEYLTVQQNDNYLDADNVLEVLGKKGITSLLIEGGRKILLSFLKHNLIDEIHLYTSNKKVNNASLINPIIINKEWKIIKEKSFESDNLLIARKKELCLQEL